LPFWSLLGAVRVSGHVRLSWSKSSNMVLPLGSVNSSRVILSFFIWRAAENKSKQAWDRISDTGTLPLDDRNINSASPRQHMSHMDCRSFVYPCQWMFIGYVCYLNSWSLEVCRTKNRLRWYERYMWIEFGGKLGTHIWAKAKS
jgi:hypothetical protein